MSPLVEHQLCKSNSCSLIILSFTCYNLKYTYIIWLTSAPIEAFACKDGFSTKKTSKVSNSNKKSLLFIKLLY